MLDARSWMLDPPLTRSVFVEQASGLHTGDRSKLDVQARRLRYKSWKHVKRVLRSKNAVQTIGIGDTRLTADPFPERPAVDAAEAADLAEACFGVRGAIRELPAELDRNFLIDAGDGGRYVLKVTPGVRAFEELDLQVAALDALAGTEMAGRVPAIVPTVGDEKLVRRTVADGSEHWLRMVVYLEGLPLAKLVEQPHSLLEKIGGWLARLDLALMDFDHPGARRRIPWDLTRTLELADSLQLIEDPARRDLIAGHLERFERRVAPRLDELRRSVIHNDANDHNLLVNTRDPARPRFAGVIDFGDMIHTVTIAELAIGAAYPMLGRKDPWTAASAVISGYHAVRPLFVAERELLPELIAARLCASVLMSARSRVREPDNEYLLISEQPVWDLLEKLKVSDLDDGRRAVDKACQGVHSSEEIIAIRRRHLGYNLSVSYQRPLKIVRGDGQYLFDDHGRRYLDLVNNVCHVGHCHPHVVAAGQRQMELLNTNTRYLHDNLAEYVLRLTATLPEPLLVCYLVCTGTEANDLALRLARAHTGSREIIVVDHAYHGHSPSLVEISPYKCEGLGGEGLADHARKVSLPDPYRGPNRGPDAGRRYAAEVKRAVEETVAAGRRVGAFMAESLIGCGGQVEPPDGYFVDAYAAVREAGGVCIADEVQVGFGRVGSHFWAFEPQGVVPDIVTLGKPIGNGHPLAAVVTTPEIAASFDTGMEYFNTFGGNPVSCAVGLAVLDVMEREQLQAHALEMGDRLLEGLRELQGRHELLGDVRGRGLFIGVELVTDHQSLAPAANEASEIIEKLKDRGFLVSTDGPLHNVLKIKPPMVLDAEDMEAHCSQTSTRCWTRSGRTPPQKPPGVEVVGIEGVE